MIACLLVVFAQPLQKQSVKVWVFDVGQGDAIFIDTPHKQILIDGGPDALVLERLASVMPWWDRSIDIVVNTHPHADHYLGLIPVLERYQVSQVLDADQGSSDPAYATYVSAAADRQQLFTGNAELDLGDGVRVQTLWPKQTYGDQTLDDPNDGSIILLLTFGQTSMLLTGDAGVEQELAILPKLTELLSKQGQATLDILKVGHHGSDTSSSQEFLDVIKPETAIISVGQDNDYRHPSSFILDRLRTGGTTVYRTDYDGSVQIKMLSERYKINTFHF